MTSPVIMSQVIQNHTGSISIKELSDKTSIKTEDIITTLQYLNLIQYQKGQHVVVAAPKVIEGCGLILPALAVTFILCPAFSRSPRLLTARLMRVAKRLTLVMKYTLCRHLKAAGSPGLVVDPGKIVW